MNLMEGKSQAIHDKKGKFEKWNMMGLESKLTEDDRSESIVTTLFAKPSSGKPFLTLSQLKKGIYEEALYLSLKSYILFSDIGHSVWKAAMKINNNSKLELARTSLLEEDKSWQVIIRNPDLTVLINSIRFKPIGKYQSAFYNSIEVRTNPATLLEFVRLIMDNLNRKPWEDEGGEIDWASFTKKAQVSRKDVIEQWAMLSNIPELFRDSANESLGTLCIGCKKSLEKKWIFCPFCGNQSNRYHEEGSDGPQRFI